MDVICAALEAFEMGDLEETFRFVDWIRLEMFDGKDQAMQAAGLRE